MPGRNPRRHGFAVGDRIVILTKAGGCYDGKMGIVTAKLDRGFLPDSDARRHRGRPAVLPGHTPVERNIPRGHAREELLGHGAL